MEVTVFWILSLLKVFSFSRIFLIMIMVTWRILLEFKHLLRYPIKNVPLEMRINSLGWFFPDERSKLEFPLR